MEALKPSAPDLPHHERICRIPVVGLDYQVSTRVLVRPIGLDMVEVGGSNPPGPTRIKNPPLGGFFGFGGVGLNKSRCSTNATKGAFGPPQQSGAPQGSIARGNGE